MISPSSPFAAVKLFFTLVSAKKFKAYEIRLAKSVKKIRLRDHQSVWSHPTFRARFYFTFVLQKMEQPMGRAR
jgi:hypothetical protein